MPKIVSGEYDDIEVLERGDYRAITFQGLVHRLGFMPDAIGDGLMVEIEKGDSMTALLPHEHVEALHAFLTQYLEEKS